MRIRTTKQGAAAPSAPGDPRPAGPWCSAPSAALYFAPDGSVLPCCAGRLPIGWVTGPNRASLRELWRGERVQQIRAAVAADDLSLGCAECAMTSDSGGREASLAIHFDRYRDRSLEWPSDLEFALSNTCNLQCVMCNGELSSAIRSQREHRPPLPAAYDDRFFAELAEFLPHAERVAFKGGEPFLAREARRVMDLMIEQGSTAEVKVTTNGSVWNDRVERFARELRMSPILSIDSMEPGLLEQLRVGVDAEVFWRNVDRFEAVASEVGTAITFSYCLMRTNWQELAPLLAEAARRGAYVDVNFVAQPADQTLLGMGAALDDVLVEMRRQGEALDLSDPSLARVWDQALQWVAHCRPVEVVVEPRGVAPVAPPASGAAPEPSAPRPVDEEALQALRSWSGADLLVIEAPLGSVAEVVPPSWADGWPTDGWIGEPTTAIQDRVAGCLGVALDRAVEFDERGEMIVRLQDPAGRERLRVLVHKPGRDETIYLALAPA